MAMCRISSPDGFTGSQGPLYLARTIVVAFSRGDRIQSEALDLIDEISRDLVPDVSLVVSSFPQPLMDYKHRARPRAFSR